MADAPAVAVRNLSKTYRSGWIRTRTVHALKGVSLNVAPGEIFGLLGPNGAGKTTLVKILLSLVHPTGGEATLFGTSVAAPAARWPVGFLPEDHRFPGFLTARKMLDTYGALSGISAEERQTRIPELLEKVDMTEAADAKIKTFSKGMLQRTGLAQALLSYPKLVFLDEPTDGVDPVGRRQIRDLLVWLREQGTTVFLNSHLLSEVEQVCSRVAILNKGELVRQGPIEELTATEHVYDLQATHIPEPALRSLGEAISHTDETGANGRAGAVPPGMQHYRVRADSRAHLNDMIDHLRNTGVELEAIIPVRQTLEDYFIDVVSGTSGTEERKRESGEERI